MDYEVRDWMSDLVVFVDPDTTMLEIIHTMRRRYINSVIVNKTADSPEYGIITSTDVCHEIVAQQKNPKNLKAHEIMKSPIITVNEHVSLKECAELIRANKIHHLPVISNEGVVIGMISATDFLVVAETMGHAPNELLS